MLRSFAVRAAPLALALPLILGGCGDGGAPAGNKTKQVRIANPGSDRLKALSPLYQRIGLLRAIRASGKRCRRVDRLGYQQEYEQLAMWVALCEDNRTWAIFIAPNENVQVRDCAEHAQLGLPVCRQPPPLPADPDDPPSRNQTEAARPATGPVPDG